MSFLAFLFLSLHVCHLLCETEKNFIKNKTNRDKFFTDIIEIEIDFSKEKPFDNDFFGDRFSSISKGIFLSASILLTSLEYPASRPAGERLYS